jgi:hypothetical protein
MPIDPAKALGAEISGGSFSWDRDRVILYHLGLGAGSLPLDPGELEYTYEKHLKVLPSFGVCTASRTSRSTRRSRSRARSRRRARWRACTTRERRRS